MLMQDFIRTHEVSSNLMLMYNQCVNQAKLTTEKNALSMNFKKLTRDVAKVACISSQISYFPTIYFSINVILRFEPFTCSIIELLWQLETFKRTLMQSLEEEEEDKINMVCLQTPYLFVVRSGYHIMNAKHKMIMCSRLP